MNAWRIIPVWLLAWWLAGCAATATYDDPAAVMMDRSKEPSRRLAAVQQLGPIRDSADPEHTASQLHELLWSDAQPTALRLYALDRLIEFDGRAFWQTARRRILEVDQWEVLRPLIDRAATQQNPALTPMLVRSLARPSQIMSDQDRPELAAIASLNPGQDAGDVIWGVLVTKDPAVSTAERVDAWVLLNRLNGQAAALDRLRHTTSTQPLVLDLQAALWLGRLPDTREGVLWLIQVRGETHRPFWQAAEARADRLSPEQRRGLELRHLPALLLASDEQLHMDTMTLRDKLMQRVNDPAAVRTHAGIARKLPSERLADHIDELCYADLLTIDQLLDAMGDHALTDSLFHQADADLADTRTEYGGVIAAESNRLVAIPFMPTIKAHDQKFYASDSLVNRLYTGLLHYHFHAQKHRNAEYAGPGVGDLKFVNNLRTSAVVFTFLNENTLNVDYYQPGDVVIDLGVIRR